MTALVLAILVAVFAGIVLYFSDEAADVKAIRPEDKAACSAEDYELSDKIAAKL